MNIPIAATEAATEAIYKRRATALDSAQYTDRDYARAAIEAAMPAIREAIAQEIEDYDEPLSFVDAFTEAARIVRGGTP